MNERIKELMTQATVEVRSHGAFGESERYSKLDPEKFAELIVRESGKYLMSPEFIGRSDLDWAMVLNEHFGVE